MADATPPAGTPPAGTPPAGTPPAGTPPAGTPPAGTPPAGTPPAASWTEGLDAASSAFVSERGWKGTGDMLTSYRNLEKLTGVPADQIIKLPKDMADPSMGEVWTRLGKPATAADYKLDTIKGSDPELSKVIAGIFHEAHTPIAMAQKITAKYNEHFAAVATAQQTAYNAKVEQDKTALRTEWGQKHDSNVEIAKTAAKAFGVSEAQMGALEKAMGFAGVHKFMFALGAKIGEAEFVQGGGKPGDFTGMTPESAKGRITELKRDNSYIARFNSKDPTVAGEARAEMRRLEKVAYPGQQTI